MKKILITGLAGFIGFHLARVLKARNDFVIGCDNFNTYYDVKLKEERVALLHKEGIVCEKIDICNAVAIEKMVIDHEITHIVHLAAQAGVRYSIQHPEVYVETNLSGFVKMLEVCRRHPNIKLIYASSSSVYGLNTKQPFSETDPTDQPASLYGATKKANEVMAHAYHHLYGIAVTGLRFFTVYGPWGRPDMAYFSFTKDIINGRPIQVYDAGKMKRDFTYIDDIVSGIVAAVDKGFACEIFNLGNNKPEDVQELISLIENVTGKKAIQDLLPMQPGDVPVTYADIEKSQKLLGFVPKTSLKEGLGRFVEWYKTHH